MIGNIKKMQSKHTNPISYKIPIGDSFLPISDYLGRKINVQYLGEINCIGCNRPINKSFAQGYCYPCFIKSPYTSECILRPELCQAHIGVSRDDEWSKKHCLADHYVYLSLTAGVKVGVTRKTQIPTRWIDQGAVQAIKIAKTPNRYLAGEIEIKLKQFISDRTAWQKMLKNDINYDIDIIDIREGMYQKIESEYNNYIYNEDGDYIFQEDEFEEEIFEFSYPVDMYPQKIKSISLDKTDDFTSKLIGIKGQYLLFDDNLVFNVRKHTGYQISLKVF